MAAQDLRDALVVLALPFAAFLLLGVVRPLRRRGRLAGIVSIVAVAAALVVAVRLELFGAGSDAVGLWPWLPGDGGPMASVGAVVDVLSRKMLVLVTLVSLLVQIYSLGYLHEESAPGLGRYFAYHALFAFSMLGLVLSPSFLQMFIFWELVGLCSYLLIGYYYDRPSAARAAVKAFWITRLGDLGFVAGIVMLWAATGTFDFAPLFAMAKEGTIPFEGFGLVMFLIYLGAVGKSAQFPLHVWLPDAMEGPTPVSALIHAATMVTAGVFMVTRAYPLFVAAPDVLWLIGTVGAFTALLAATMACVENDIKRVLAYSTVSQLSFMMAAIGSGVPRAGFLHLLTHGLFKALLFLGAGAVIHAVGTNDIFRMGRLFRALPGTGTVFLVGTLALAGIPPLPGFFSKEAILTGVWESGRTGVFAVLALTAFLTAFYMFRVMFVAFFGRAHAPYEHAHDAPPSMAVPLWVLAGLTVLAGLRLAMGGGEEHAPPWLLALSLALAVAGFVLAWAAYQAGVVSASALASTFPLSLVDSLARRRYFLDALYAGLYRGVMLGFSRLIGWIDRYLVDGLLNFLSACTLRGGDLLRGIQSGRAQDYLYGVAFGLLALVVWAQLWLRRP
ncbi:MAG: NADH-quinone oxidoreductase subunit L [Candidatus Rokubacteria bacterium]|nr:NADH-quinone oxidoreductase subunit L [Candidatus Rokubacteria bacterium]